MAPAMTGPHTAAAEITKITAMRAHDHQSLSADCAGAAVEFLRVSALWSFATRSSSVGMTHERKWTCVDLRASPKRGSFRMSGARVET